MAYKRKPKKRIPVIERIKKRKKHDPLPVNRELAKEAISADNLPVAVDRAAMEDAKSRMTSPFAHYPGQMGSSKSRMPVKEAQYLDMFRHDRHLMRELAVAIRKGDPEQIKRKRRNLEVHRSRMGTVASYLAKEERSIASPSETLKKG